MPLRGFILQPTYRIVSGRAVVHLYGRLEDGRSFLVRDDRHLPRFYVRQGDTERAKALGAAPLTPSGRVSLDGLQTALVEVSLPADAPPLRDRLRKSGIPCFEADVRFAISYLIDRRVRGTLSIRGKGRSPGQQGSVPLSPRVDIVFDNPDLDPCDDWSPSLSVLSIDIETDPRASRLLSIALHGCGAEEVLLLCAKKTDCPARARPCSTERELIARLCARVMALDPDVLTGWNFIDFDLAVLSRLAEEVGIPLVLGRTDEPLRLRPLDSGRRRLQASIPGRIVLDGLDLLRGAFVKMERYSLDFVARELLGVGKTVTGSDRASEILRMYRTDREKFVEYNLTDARLVLDILDELHLVSLAVERSKLTGMPPDRVSASIASFDYLYLGELHRRNVVAPSVGEAAPEEPTAGGHVLEPETGLHENVLVFDFKSLYPSIIRTFQIDPLGLVRDDQDSGDSIIAPNGVAFRREPGILPGILDQLFPRREAARAAGDKVASQAIKILMNSFYGVLGTPACRFYDPRLANAITSFGRELLLWTKSRCESSGHRVIYGDTDSLFVSAGCSEAVRAGEIGRELCARLNGELDDYVRERWQVDSRLELEFEKLYLRLLLPPMRHGTGGARKRYAGLLEGKQGRRVEFVGMEVVRRDWTKIAKVIQRELYERLFTDRAVDEYLEAVVTELRAGRHDDLLVYRKALRKSLDSYTSTTPPHVAAARKLSGRPGRSISYLMTTGGPEPEEERKSPIDHEHYVQKQVRPVTEPVLAVLGLEFDRVVGDDRQGRLF